MSKNDIKITYLALNQLVSNPRNARTHSKKQIQQIAKSIEAFGFNNPVLIDQQNVIIAGHGRVEAAKLLSFSNVPTIRLEHLTEDQKRAYIIADNKLAELAGWDKSILAIELQHLITIDTSFEVSITGFSTPEIDLIIQGIDAVKEESFQIDESLPVISKPGDLWRLGDHLIFCGDALDGGSYQKLLGNEKADLVFTDPPYNVSIPKHVCGLGKVQHENFAMASGEMSSAEFTGFLSSAFVQLAQYSRDGSIHYICMDWRHMVEVLTAGNRIYSELKNICVWNKDNAGMGSLYRSKHEFVAVFKQGKAAHINNIELGKHGRYRTNVWDYPGQNSLHPTRGEELAMHPTVKPVAMVADAILDCSHRKDLVLDPFGGSGTTLLAAEKTGRHARLIELEPKYVDVTVRRWQSQTGGKAVHVLSGVTFNNPSSMEV